MALGAVALVVACGASPESVPDAAAHAAAAAAASDTATATQALDPADPAGAGQARGVDAEDIDVERFPVVVAADATTPGDGTWRFAVTLSSPYDTPQRYADAWRVLDGDDRELGIRVLLHDHANEQPFTRSHTIEVPADIGVVFVEGRDQEHGWSGQRLAVELATG